MVYAASPQTTSTKGKVALITGVSGQDGAYLAELLLIRHGVSVVAGIGYGDSCDKFVRISVGAESLERIRTAIERLSALPSRQ